MKTELETSYTIGWYNPTHGQWTAYPLYTLRHIGSLGLTVHEAAELIAAMRLDPGTFKSGEEFGRFVHAALRELVGASKE